MKREGGSYSSFVFLIRAESTGSTGVFHLSVLRRSYLATLALLLFAMLLAPPGAQAYIGPGAGIAFVSSFLVILTTLFLAFVTLLTWPFRWLVRVVRGRTALRRSRVKKVVIVGLDGQDPKLTREFMSQGLLPNFAKLMQTGSYADLGTTYPAESPVAWSSFQTGCNPGRHKVFDFLVPNRKSYLPELCSARIEPPSRHLSIGRYRFPLGKPKIQFDRKSQSFWKILSDHGVFSTIIRVPISFPPEKFKGLLLSAMSAPDLRGTQGTFSYYSSDPDETNRFTGGIQIGVARTNGEVKSHILGPENPILKEGGEMKIPFSVLIGSNGDPPTLSVHGRRYPLRLKNFTPWIPLEFKAAVGMKVRGMSRFYLKETAPHFKLYMTPVNISPDKPALPISQPVTYSMYLSKTQGPFSTLGLAEDTWALNERVLDEEAFLQQAYSIHEERERMLFDALDKTTRGAVVCVFDITDRLQHMFWRYLEPDHPANRDKDVERHRDEIRTLYQRMDDLVGRVMEKVNNETVLVVMSDHGFSSFKRSVSLNTWLYQNGYLAVKDQPTGEEWFRDVDWSQTRAYAVGLGGIYLNVAGREGKGIVPASEAQALKHEIIVKLRHLIDPESGTPAIRDVYDTRHIYRGPYASEGPDLIVGFAPGYRVSWASVTGAVSPCLFEDNVKSWSGDHCLNPPDVPGIFFTNRKIKAGSVSIMDVGPTVLDLFGVPVPEHCDGVSLMPEGGATA
ncbi:MAG: nucleotide pyrophosphatase [Acidobacteria bacterium]|nr:MAG: nucleotide pyrophosphatase [Acidobacteriota bacterium]